MSRLTEVGRLRGQLVLVQESAEPVAAVKSIQLQEPSVPRRQIGGRRFRQWWSLCEGAVWPVLVVMRHVLAQNRAEVAAAEDEEPVEAAFTRPLGCSVGCQGAQTWRPS